jgi:hypothetical protein
MSPMEAVSEGRWIALKYLQKFPEAVFLEVAMKSIPGDEEMRQERLV